MVIHYHDKCRSEGGRGHTSVLLLLPTSLQSQPITTRQQRTNPRRVLAECLLGNNIHTHSDYTANYG